MEPVGQQGAEARRGGEGEGEPVQQLLGTPTDGCTWWLQAWLPAGFIIPGARESDPGVSEGHTRGGCIFVHGH